MKKLFSNRYVQIGLLLLIAFYGFKLWKGQNDGFAIDNIVTQIPNNPAWNVAKTPEKLNAVNACFNQPYTYIGHGFQFYAFESADGKYVLKFLRQQRLRPPVMYDWLPNWALFRDLKEKKTGSRKKRQDLLFQALMVAYKYAPKETGLIYMHLNKTQNEHPKVHIVDRQENSYEVSLDGTEFVLQHKAFLIKPTIKALMVSGQVKEARERIDQLFQLMMTCAKKGIIDRDRALIRKDNVGYTKTGAIYIDIGKLARRDSSKTIESFQHDLRRLKPLYRWLLRNYPGLAAHFDKAQKKAIESFKANATSNPGVTS